MQTFLDRVASQWPVARRQSPHLQACDECCGEGVYVVKLRLVYSYLGLLPGGTYVCTSNDLAPQTLGFKFLWRELVKGETICPHTT